MVVGLAAYGRTWTLSGSPATAGFITVLLFLLLKGYGTATTGTGTAGTCTQEGSVVHSGNFNNLSGGFLSSFEIQAFVASGAVSKLDQYSQVCYHY